MDTQQHTGWDPADYLRKARESDARYLADTRTLINATTIEQLAEALTAISGGPVYFPGETTPSAALGTLQFRTEQIIRCLEAAESRIAELEAERDRPRVTGRDALLGSMGTGNVHDDDEESLQFADEDESEWMDDDESEWMDDERTITIVEDEDA